MNARIKFVAPLLISAAFLPFADSASAGPLPSQPGFWASAQSTLETQTTLEQVQYRRGGGWRGGGYRRGGGGGWIGPAIIGGAIIGGAIAATRPYGYYDGYAYGPGPGPGYVYAPAPAYGGGAAAYCAQRFRSWDPATGTYLGYDGLRHPCP
jgi:hypothetical protein